MRDRKVPRAIPLYVFLFFSGETFTSDVTHSCTTPHSSTRARADRNLTFVAARELRSASARGVAVEISRLASRALSQSRARVQSDRTRRHSFAGSRRRRVGVSRFPFRFGNVKRKRAHIAICHRSRCRPSLVIKCLRYLCIVFTSHSR